MSIRGGLTGLSVSQLTILLEHLRLGESHLKKRLEPQQFSELLQLTVLNPAQAEAVKANQIEKKGNVAKAIDGLLTGIIGSWLGYIGFVESRLDSPQVFVIIICIAAAIGLASGYYNYRLVKAKEHEAKVNQKLHNLQHILLKIIAAKKKTASSRLTLCINEAVNMIGVEKLTAPASQKFFEFSKDTSQWLKQLTNKLQPYYNFTGSNESIYTRCITEINITFAKLVTLLERNNWSTDKPTYAIASSSAAADQNNLMEILTNPKKITVAEIIHKPAWWHGNLRELVTGVIPAFLGGFGSIFLYFGGMPKQAGKFGIPGAKILLHNPTARVIELILGLCLAFYYVLVFINNKKKASKRQIEITATSKHITNLEKRISERSKKLAILKTVKARTEKILFITSILEQLQQKSSFKQENTRTGSAYS